MMRVLSLSPLSTERAAHKKGSTAEANQKAVAPVRPVRRFVGSTKKMNRVAAIPVAGLLAGAAHGQIGPRHPADWQTSRALEVQGGSIPDNFTTGSFEAAVAAADTGSLTRT